MGHAYRDEPADGRASGAHRRPAAQVRHARSTLHVVPDRRPLYRGIRPRRCRSRAASPRCGQFVGRALAVRAHTVLRVAVLLLRLQQDHHQAPRASRRVSRRARDRAGAGGRVARHRPPGVAAAPGRRLAHLPVGCRARARDAGVGHGVSPDRRLRGVDRGRPAHRHARPPGALAPARFQPAELRRAGLRPRLCSRRCTACSRSRWCAR